jgi:glycosyltransferase involved in cell wall biosynthesis
VPAGNSEALAAAMARLIEDPELRDRIGRQARERARAFTPEVVVPKVERLYLDTVTRFRRSQA